MEWQPIKTCPAEKYDVLVYWSDGNMSVLDGIRARRYAVQGYSSDQATHWMLLPEPPNAPLTGAAKGD